MFRDFLDFHRELIWRIPWRHVNTMTDLKTRGSSLPSWIRRKTEDRSDINLIMGLLIWPMTHTPLATLMRSYALPPSYSPFWDCTEVRTVRMSTKLDIHTSFIQNSSIVVYFSRVCGLDRRPKRSVKHIVHCMQPHSICSEKATRFWINLNSETLLISVIMFTKCIASCSSKVNITLDRSRGIESLLILAPCLCGSVLVVIALMP